MYHYVYEEKLKNRLEHVLLDPRGLVLMPVSNKSNILNLLVVLENLFNRSQKLQSPVVRPNPDDRPVVYLEHTAKDTLDVAKSHLNWMNFRGRHYFQDIDDNPFAFKNISTVSSAAELVTELEEPRPRVVVASAASLEAGLGKLLLRKERVLDKASSMIIFTEVQNLADDCLSSRILAGDKMINATWFERVKKNESKKPIVDEIV